MLLEEKCMSVSNRLAYIPDFLYKGLLYLIFFPHLNRASFRYTITSIQDSKHYMVFRIMGQDAVCLLGMRLVSLKICTAADDCFISLEM